MKNKLRIASLLMALVLIIGMVPAAIAEEKVTLRFLWWGNETRQNATIAVIEAYQKLHPNVTIEAEYGSFDGHYQKLITQLVGGEAPDLMQVDNSWIYDFANRGEFFVDLYSQTDVIDITGFDQKTLEQTAVVNGELHGLPFGCNSLLFLVNTEFMEKYGFSADTVWTWETLLTEGKKIHDQDPNAYLMNCDFRTLRSLIVPEYIYQKTGKMYAQDDYTIGVTRDDFIDAFTYVKALYDNGVIQPIDEAVLYELKTEQNPKWINGEFGGIITWAAQIADWKNGVDYPLAASHYPVPEAGANQTTVYRPAMFFSINKTSEHIDVCADFMNFWYNSEEATRLLGTVRSVPPTTGAQQLLAGEGLIDADIAKAVDMAAAAPSDALSAMVTDTSIEQILADTIQKMAYDMITPEQAADEFMYLLDAKLAEMKAAL